MYFPTTTFNDSGHHSNNDNIIAPRNIQCSSASQYRRSLGQTVSAVAAANRNELAKMQQPDMENTRMSLGKFRVSEAPIKPRNKDAATGDTRRPLASVATEEKRTSVRKSSLGLSYGPVVSSMEDQSAGISRRRNVSLLPNSSQRHTAMGTTVGNSSSVEDSRRQQQQQVERTAGAKPLHQPLEHSISSRRQIAGSQPMSSSSSSASNTLAMDNWFEDDGGGIGAGGWRIGGDGGIGSVDYDRSGDIGGGGWNVGMVSKNGGNEHHGGRRNTLQQQHSHSPEKVYEFVSGREGRRRSSLLLRDLDEDESKEPDINISNRPVKSGLMRDTGKPFTLELATELRVLLFGTANRGFPSGWEGQGFSFCNIRGLRFGLEQRRGGPCGVMAAVQAHLIQTLAFGSNKADDPLDPTDEERENALSVAMVAILERCRKQNNIVIVMPSSKAHFAGVGRYKNDGVSETLNLQCFSTADAALNFAKENPSFSDGTNAVICFLYSALLTRGLANVKADMDSPETPLMGAHGYCTQEMVNLMVTGHAVSNVFDGDVDLGGTVLRGVSVKSDVGLLSLFEHYGSCAVGENLKSPRLPIWLICSESHFTVLFSLRLGDEKVTAAERGKVNLVYYDGLSRQEQRVVLTIDCSGGSSKDKEDELPSPIEHCLRTKWREVAVDWNGSERIL